MSIKSIERTHANYEGIRGNRLLLWLMFLVFALAICATKSDAQIIGDIDVNVPFGFHAGNTKLPAGDYHIHMLDNSDLTIMEITSADGSTSALFQVQEADANSTPAKSELIFNKYGDRYFLSALFDEGNSIGSKVVESRYEKRVSQQNGSAQTTQEHVPTRHQKGN